MITQNYLASLAIEQRVARIIAEQATTGWLFNSHKAMQLIKSLRNEMLTIDKSLRSQLPVKIDQWGVTISEPFKMNGKPKKMVEDWYGEVSDIVHGPFTRITFTPMNLGSDPQLKDFLLSIGWKPKWWNFRKKDTANGKKGDKTGPKITKNGDLCPNLEALSEGLGGALAQYLKCKHRKGLLEGLLKRVRPDGRISGEANTIGAATFRMTHKNIVNIPGGGAFLGHEIRSLFIAKKGYSILGCDSKGNQVRMLCHYMGDEEYTQKVLNEDIHVVHRDAAGFEPTDEGRSQAKTFFYGFIFGAGDAKTGEIVHGTAADGARLKATFLNNLPKMKTLVNSVKRVVERRGYLLGLDGRRIPVPSAHKALNYLLQGAEAVYMKYSQAFLWKWIRDEGLDAKFVATIHDEYQLEVRDEHLSRVKALALKAMLVAGKHLNITLPMEGDAKSGRNWAETH